MIRRKWNGVTALDAISITYGENAAIIDTVVIEGDQGEKGVTDVSTTIIDIVEAITAQSFSRCF